MVKSGCVLYVAIGFVALIALVIILSVGAKS